MQGVYVNVPAVDWSLFRELIRKFGCETREQLLDIDTNLWISLTPSPMSPTAPTYCRAPVRCLTSGERWMLTAVGLAVCPAERT